MEARTLQGHAARAGVDKWILIQENTFRNWVNEQLRTAGMSVEDLETDFDNGCRLCALIESLQGKRVKVIKNPRNPHQQLENVSQALTAIANDNIRLVNIGPADICNGNLKLILGLIWHLILRYQIGKSKFPTKKIMIAWLQAVIPECGINNFTSDWNDGVALHALIDFCRPGLCPDWRNLSRRDALENCRQAMNLANNNFSIPLVVRPEDLSSPDLDELSGMTYLSYFMKLDSPGYHATLSLVRRLLRQGTVNNFTSDWSNGSLLCHLVKSVGGDVSGYPTMTGDAVEDMQRGMDGAGRLGIGPILTAKEMTDPEVDHIGIMAYAAYFNSFKPVRSSAEKALFSSLPRDVFVGQEASFSIHLEDDDASAGDVRADVQGPDSRHTVRFNWVGRTGEGSFTPTETGLHKLNVYCESQMINGCPASFKVLADRSKITFRGVDKCALGHLTELQVNSAAAGQGEVRIEARAPNGRSINMSPVPRMGNYVSNFNPTEVGDWEISVQYDGEHISGSPFTVRVYDSSAVRVYGLEGGTVGQGLTFNADATRAGEGSLRCEVRHQGHSVYSRINEDRSGLYKIDFTPEGSGSYQVTVFFNDDEVRGCPYTLEIADTSNVTVSGDGLNLVPINRTASFEVDPHGASHGTVDCEISAPKGNRVASVIRQQPDGKHKVEFYPTVSGDHIVAVRYSGQEVKGSPWTVRVYDAGQVIVSNMPIHSTINKPVVFDIDASKAGSGNIEIMVNGGKIACSVQNHGSYKFTASFTPVTAEEHVVEMKFNDVAVKGSPWHITVMDPQRISASGSGLQFVAINRTASFVVKTEGNKGSNLMVNIRGPNGDNVPCSVQQRSSDYLVEYTPLAVGDHVITVKYGDNEVSDSPFTAKSYNTAAIDVDSLPDGVVGQRIEFGIDVTRAGEGQLEIMVNNGNLPNTVESERTGVYKMSFVPEEAGKQNVEIIFNKESHPRSPFICEAIDLSAASVSSFELNVVTDRVSSFIVRSSAASAELNVDVQITSPSGEQVPVQLERLPTGDVKVDYIPREAGDHTVNVTYMGIHIDESPYTLNAYNAKLVHLSKMPLGILGIPFKFRVLANHAGEGKVEVSVEADGKVLPSDLDPLEMEGTCEGTFIGVGETAHTLNITFNDEHIPGSPVTINFADVDKIKLKKPAGYPHISINQPCGLRLTSAKSALDDLHIKMLGTQNEKIPVKLLPHTDELYTCDWTPTVAGTYDLDITYGKMIPIWGSPLSLKVFDSKKVLLLASPGKPDVGERYTMKVDATEAGDGALEVVVLCEGEVIQSDVCEGDNDLIWVSFVPQEFKRYDVYLAFNKEPIPGSPFIYDLTKQCNTVALYKNKKQFIVEQLQWCFLQTLSYFLPIQNLTIWITAPNGESVRAEIYRQSDGEYKVEWTPRMPGRHTVDVHFGGRQIEGSPFYVDVFDLACIRIDNFRHTSVGEDAGFSVDYSQAGCLDLGIRIVNPSGHDVMYDDRELGHHWRDYIYEPEEPGQYQIYIKYGGFTLPGSPYTQEIADGGMPTASGEGLSFAEEDKVANFNVVVGRRKGDLRVQVTGPNSIAKVNVDPQSDGSYNVTYVPVETGIFDISVMWNINNIAGSPYHPKVIDVRKVKVIGGWQHFMDSNERVNLVVGEMKQLPFDISEAGPGVLRAEIEGPRGSVSCSIDKHTMGRNTIEFTPEHEGNHYIHIFWCDLPLVNSPFLGYAIHQVQDANKVILTGRGLKEAIIREEAAFIIDGSQAGNGTPEVVLSGVRAEVSVRVVSQGNGKFYCSYNAVVPGAYLLHITWNNRQLRGSPYKVNVIGAFFPNRVVVLGDGLRGGILGERMNINIDTRKAGPGELTAFCMGSHQVAYCELEDNRDGTFRLGIKPQESGQHVLQIKYGGEHVQGSPFALKVTAQPDASKVRVTGPGVEHGILATFISRFVVETRGAGAGQLTVRIKGPKGGFQVEMYRDSQRDRTILCRFDPTEVGLYLISVKWSGRDVPGSPFHIQIMDTQQELEQALNESSISMGGSFHSSRVGYNQWRENI